jgi:hypothetical protein
MTTILSNSPLRSLAHVLYAAAATGPGAWGRGDDDDGPKSAEAPSESMLTSDLHALFSLLRERQVPYLLVGGVAMLRYIEGRNTDDIDIIVALEDAARVPEIIIEERSGDAAKARFRSVRVDLLFTRNNVFRLVMERYGTTHQFAEIAVPCATVEGLVLLKLYALPSLYQQGNMQRAALYETDILMLCQRHAPDTGRLVETLRPHLGRGEFEEVERILGEIAVRLQRMRRSTGE